MVARPLVIKFGGELLEDRAHLATVVGAVATISTTGTPLVVVHGGGREIDAALKVAGIDKRQVDGLRITDDATLDVVVSVLAGAVNTRLVAALTTAGVATVGLTGADMGAGYLLPRVVGMGRAFELLLLGDTIDVVTAARYGLVNRIVPHEELLPAAHQWAKRLADGPTLAISMTKRMLNQELHMDLISAIEAEAQAQALMLMGDDHRKFYEAFQIRQRKA